MILSFPKQTLKALGVKCPVEVPLFPQTTKGALRCLVLNLKHTLHACSELTKIPVAGLETARRYLHCQAKSHALILHQLSDPCGKTCILESTDAESFEHFLVPVKVSFFVPAKSGQLCSCNDCWPMERGVLAILSNVIPVRGSKEFISGFWRQLR